MLKSHIFREYDIRGIVDQDYDEQGVFLLGQTFATKVQQTRPNSKIVVAFDGRLSSPRLEQAFVNGLKEKGADVIRLGRGPTPLLYFGAHFLEADGAVMITGSHNPPAYNGFKMMIGSNALFGEEIRDLKRLSEILPSAGRVGTEKTLDLKSTYIERIIGALTQRPEAFKYKIGWDPGNGATGEILHHLVQRLGGEHFVINGEIDGTFPAHHPDPTIEENLEQLKELVRNEGCDFGIAFDGDGDRLGIVDTTGKMLYGDQILAFLVGPVLKEFPGATIISDVKASQHLFEYIQRQGGVPLMWRTGHSLIKQKMKEVNSPFAGEMSGHIFFADRYYGYDDALYAALRFIETACESSQAISEWLAGFPQGYHTPELHIPCETKNKFAVISQIQSFLEHEQVPFNDIDGVRVQMKEGWWLLRASNTQEILVGRAEAASQNSLQEALTMLKSYLERAGIPINSLIKGLSE